MENGFIRDLTDVKVLVLYVLKLADKPLDVEKIYELCFVDNRLTYFDICEVLPQLAERGMVEEVSAGLYVITEVGKGNVEILGSTIAFTLRSKAAKAVAADMEEEKKNEFIRADVVQEGENYCGAVVLRDNFGPLMKLELAAPDKTQARRLSELLRRNAPQIYKALMDDLTLELDNHS